MSVIVDTLTGAFQSESLGSLSVVSRRLNGSENDWRAERLEFRPLVAYPSRRLFPGRKLTFAAVVTLMSNAEPLPFR